ncbi:hypothetical protein EPI10_029562 [Gossypium australe]|uniref:Uncharacterized protein n=1 Tax=Gossypium australe TaxID=47621 RepID=A0A5B6V1V4_9ROSI|nr:hypothetical protein EPI10_029562 [Gossypium australe]
MEMLGCKLLGTPMDPNAKLILRQRELPKDPSQCRRFAWEIELSYYHMSRYFFSNECDQSISSSSMW